MDNKQKELNAKRVYTALCTALDELHLHYSKNTLESGSMVCDFKMESDDLPLSIRILVSPSAEILSIYSSLPFAAKKNVATVALAVCMINDRWTVGGYDYNYAEGELLYRINMLFHGTTIGKESIKEALYATVSHVDKTNDLLYDVARGTIDLEGVMNRLEKKED
jgi:hypothetical protein